MKRPWVVGMGIVLTWAGAAVLASRLPSPDGAMAHDSGEATSVVSRLFGSGRELISQQLYQEADRYFHRGASHVSERAFENHPYLRWAESITPTAHAELQGDGIEEIMPWLQMAARADPRNISAYTTAAFWLNNRGKVDAVRAVLGEAREKNPGDYRVPLALGQLLYHDGLLDDALTELEQTRAEWPSGQDTGDRQTQLDLATALALAAGIHELQGHPDAAIAEFREILSIFPGREGIRERLRQLEQGEAAGDAADFLNDQLAEISAAGEGRHIAGGGHAHEHDQHDRHDPDQAGDGAQDGHDDDDHVPNL